MSVVADQEIVHRTTTAPRGVYVGQYLPPRVRLLIVTGDDLGLTYSFNEGILAAHQKGFLSNTCIRANGLAYGDALERVLPACPDLGVGIHLCLNEGRPVAPADRIPLLLETDGKLRQGYAWLIRLARTTQGCEQIETELQAQLDKLIGDGVQPDHINSHQHVHMIPRIFSIVCRLAKEYGCGMIRLPRERLYVAGGWAKWFEPFANRNLLKHVLLNRYARINAAVLEHFGLHTTDEFVGVNYTGCMTGATLAAGLNRCRGQSVEVLLHPTSPPDERDTEYPTDELRRYSHQPQRRVELKTLCDPQLAGRLWRQGWRLATYGDLQEHAKNGQVCVTDMASGDFDAIRDLPLHQPAWVSAAHDDACAFADAVCQVARPGERILDLGTGTGVLAISLSKQGRHVVASDVSAASVRTAQHNASRVGEDFPLFVSDLLADVPGTFDLVAFNLPYGFMPDNCVLNLAKNLFRRVSFIRHSSGRRMPEAVARFHKRLLLRLFKQAKSRLNPGGRFALHVFETELDQVIRLAPRPCRIQCFRHPMMTPNETVCLVIQPV